MKALPILLIFSALTAAAERRVIFPAGAKPVGPYSPGIFAGEFLYVSGQGARGPDGKIPAGFEAQARQSFENVKSIVETAGLTMEHVVYSHVYMENAANYDVMNKIWAEYFTRGVRPARATVGVYKMPTDTPIEINAVAVRDLARKKAIVPAGYPANAALSPGVMVGDRLYLSGFLGRDIDSGKIPAEPAAQVQLALDRVKQTLAAAGMDFRHMVFVNPYLTGAMPMEVMNKVYASHFEFGNTPARATIRVSSLPNGANIEFTGVAVRDLSQRRAVRPKNMPPSATASPCVFAGDTFYCSAKSGFIPGPNGGIYAGDVENQVRQTMRNLLDGLEEAGLDFSNVVASNVYVDDLSEFAKMNGVYGKYFASGPPSRTTVAPLPPVERKRSASGHAPMLEQVSIIAVKGQ
ncbi:MAG TPA: RidA family protein [Bryobacteraceae bacterium]|nr:RidA family protein [Bryobacteraceae bacterium]